MTGCVFCAIVAGDASAHVVLEEPEVVAFLDRHPLFPGHTLVVPRVHHETFLDIPDGDEGPFFATVKRVAAAVTDAMDARGTFVAMNNRVSQSVPHLHVHVVPRRPKDGLRGFFWPRHRYDDDAHAAEVARRIADALAAPS